MKIEIQKLNYSGPEINIPKIELSVVCFNSEYSETLNQSMNKSVINLNELSQDDKKIVDDFINLINK